MNLTTMTHADPRNARDFSPVRIGSFLVLREPLRGTFHTRYRVMSAGKTIGKQISMPSASDCATYERTFQRSNDDRERQNRALEIDGAIWLCMTDRIVNALTEIAADAQEIADIVGSKLNVVSPILNRLAKANRVLRTGIPRKYKFAAVSA